jgi:hypothetical protein
MKSNIIEKNLLSIGVSFLLLACGNTSLKGKNVERTPLLQPPVAKNSSADVLSGSAKLAVQKTANEEISGSAFRVKNAEELRSSIESCFGPKMLEVKETMILRTGQTRDPVAGRIRFLAENFTPGDDIIQKLATDLFDPSMVTRTATSANNISQAYMSALSVVADVVAHNCEPKSANCDCSTVLAATSMMQRCLPHLNLETRQKAAEVLSKSCKVLDDKSGLTQRRNLSSFVSSVLFSEKK